MPVFIHDIFVKTEKSPIASAIKKQLAENISALGWIQWKGTHVCMDIHCLCGALTHIDESFAYFVECGKCGRIYVCNQNIELVPISAEDCTPGRRVISWALDE